MPRFTSCRQLNITYRISLFNKNSTLTTKDIKNLSTKMNCTGLGTQRQNFSHSNGKMKENIHFREFVYHREVPSFGAEYFKHRHSYNLETLISELVLKRAFRKCYFYRNIQCKPVGMPTKCSIELLVCLCISKNFSVLLFVHI